MNLESARAFGKKARLARMNLHGALVTIRDVEMQLAVSSPEITFALAIGGTEVTVEKVVRIPLSLWTGAEPAQWEMVLIGTQKFYLASWAHDTLADEYVLKLAKERGR
jgi:hypothetical protein